MTCWAGSGCLLGEELNLIDKYCLEARVGHRVSRCWTIRQEEKRYIFMHNPFAAPMDEDLALLDSEPLQGPRQGLRSWC